MRFAVSGFGPLCSSEVSSELIITTDPLLIESRDRLLINWCGGPCRLDSTMRAGATIIGLAAAVLLLGQQAKSLPTCNLATVEVTGNGPDKMVFAVIGGKAAIG